MIELELLLLLAEAEGRWGEVGNVGAEATPSRKKALVSTTGAATRSIAL